MEMEAKLTLGNGHTKQYIDDVHRIVHLKPTSV